MDRMDDFQVEGAESPLRVPRPVLVGDLFPEILEVLIQLLSGLTAQEWEMPTACAGWSVKDVGLHLLGVEIGNLSGRRDRHRIGRTIQGWDELVRFVNAWNEEWVRVGRRMSTRLLVDLLALTGGQMCEYFRSLDPYTLGSSVSWVGPQRMPVWLDIAREYTERWHHQQHIRDAVGKPSLKERRYFEPVLATFVWALPQALRSTEASEATAIALTLQGQGGGQWSLRREAGTWQLYEGKAEGAEAEVVVDDEVAWRWLTRGMAAQEARERAMVRGNVRLGAKVFEAVGIIG